MYMQWQPKILKERNRSQSDVIWRNVLSSSKTSNSRKMKTIIIQNQQFPSEKNGKNVDGNWRFVVKAPNHNHPASPPEAHPIH